MTNPADDFDQNGGLVRPFMNRQLTPLRAHENELDDIRPLVRPYYITGGRARGHREIAIEALVSLTDHGHRQVEDLRLERAAIARSCVRPISLAEVAARAGVHLGVARVLVSDLEYEGILATSDASVGVADDIDLITGLINGVRAL